MPLFASFDLPQWLPDETFYSLECRYHRLSCNNSAKATLAQLFGQSQLGYQHDFPSGLDAFARRSNHTLGTVCQIIRQHTVLPYYLPMRQPGQAGEIMAAFEAGDISSLKYKLGILTSRFRAHHPLKACTECMQEDLAKYSVRYWHLSHQFPGVWICPVHRTILREAIVKANGVGRFQFYLPEENVLELSTLHRTVGDNDALLNERLSALADCSIGLAKLPPHFHFSPAMLHATYMAALSRIELITDGGSVRLKAAAQNFAKHIAPLDVIPELNLQKHDATDLHTQLGGILRTPRAGTHPLKHTLLITWLFDTWESFFSAYSTALSSTNAHERNGGNTVIRPTSDSNPVAARLVDLVQKGMSITGTAHVVGLDLSTVMSLLAQEGISSKRRPKRLRGAVLNSVIDDISRGNDIREIATVHNLSVTTVSRRKNSTVGLHDTWLEARISMQRTRSRQQWLAAMLQFPRLGRKLLRAHEPAVYMWLYRHDREWLQNNQPVERQPHIHQSPVRWDARDATLSQKVREVILALRETVGRKPIRLWQIYQQIPELKAKLEVLDRLPQTKLLLEDAVASRPRPLLENLF